MSILFSLQTLCSKKTLYSPSLPGPPFLREASRDSGGCSVTPEPFPEAPLPAFKLSLEVLGACNLCADGLCEERPLLKVLNRLTKDVLFLKL